MPVGAKTSSVHVVNPSIPVGQRPNNTPIFISGVSDNRAFLAWLRPSCPTTLTAQIKVYGHSINR
jgi:hypothetical protein